LAKLGLVFGVLTFVVGDYLAPASEQQATQLQATYKGGMKLGRSGAWVKDTVNKGDHALERNYSINVGSAGPGQQLNAIRIFEFDADNRLLRRISAASAIVRPDQIWVLKDVTVTRWIADAADDGAHAQAPEEHLATLDWRSSLSAGVVASAVSPVSSMSTVDLARYIVHLSDNEQAAQSHQIQFWKRALYPFACLVMMALALPFAYLNARSGGISLKVFGGIMLGISFVLLNNVASHLGLLRDWTPWIVAATPSALYLLLSLAAFSWLVRYR
jgi:lipopolysaccharide export system permease protein